MGRKSEFSREEKIAAVKLITEGGRSLLSVANEYGIHENTLGKWKRQYAINPDGAFNGEPVLDEASAQERELQQLKRRVRELEEENEFLKKSFGILCKEPAVKHAVIEKAAGKVGVSKACKLLKVRRQGYYEHLQRKDSPHKVQDRQYTVKNKNIFYENNRIYGARKIREELRNGGDNVSRKRVRRLMDIAGLVPVSWRRSVQTTVSDPKATPFPNLLKQDFKVALPNLTWVSDFTYVPTDEGWLYLCTFIDLFSRRVVGWAVSNTIDRHLAIAALHNVVANRHPGKHLVIHTDRGCQYTSWDFRREVAAIEGIQSMSRPGTPYENACAETFFKTLKVERIDSAHFKTRQEATDAIAEYMLFYNRRRIHQSLGYLTPVAFEQTFAA